MKEKILTEDFEIIPSHSSVVNEIFQNDFDITWHDGYKASGSTQRVWGIIPGENAKDDGTVSYHYNNDYFRSDEFVSEHNGRHVLFAGCSETEGQGGDIESSWGKILLNKIDNVSGFYNLGKAGYGWQKVISQLRIYISKYGKPDNLFVLLPNIGRSIEWSEEDKAWYAKQFYPRLGPTKALGFQSMYLSEQSVEQYKKTFIDFVISWRLFEDFCEAADIKLIWGSWQTIDDYNFSKLQLFKNFVALPKQQLPSLIDRYRENAKLEKFDLDKRDGHHGKLYHEYWADMMFEEANKRGFLDD